MDHHDNTGASAERFAVAGLLVGAVTIVTVVDKQVEAQLFGDPNRFIGRTIVDDDHQVHHVVRQFGVRHMQRFSRIVSRHDHDYFGFRHALSRRGHNDELIREQTRPKARQ